MNNKTKRIMSLALTMHGYFMIRLPSTSRGKDFNRTVSRIVAEAFISNPENKPQVNHKDGDKLNNHPDNLEWSTPSENNKHAYRNGLNHYSGFTRPVVQYSPNGEIITEFKTLTEAAVKTNTNINYIVRVCQGKGKLANGFYWKYKNTRKKVIIQQYNADGVLLNEFPSIIKAAEGVGVSRSMIHMACNGQRKTAVGYTWKRIEK